MTLLIVTPFIAEFLPGYSRFSAIFVLPIQICVWGGAALLTRAAVRHWRLGWLNMLLLAIAFSFAEEWLIQQSSVAPMVFQIMGKEYARAFDVNYVYFLWALMFETLFVVFAPVYLVELIYPKRRAGAWLSKTGLMLAGGFFVLGCVVAGFLWTQHVRPNVFHAPLYAPPLGHVLAAVGICLALVFTALGPFRRALAKPSTPLSPPPPWALGVLSFVWCLPYYGLVLLAFGIRPSFPPAVAVAMGIALIALVLALLPRWSAHGAWRSAHLFALLFGAVTSTMASGYAAFVYGTAPADLYFKIGINVAALILLIALGVRIGRSIPATAPA
jgi:hypothetical protein